MSKKFKVAAVLILTLILTAVFAGCGDFIPPNEFKELYPDLWKGDKDDPNAHEGMVNRINEKTMDDLINYLYENGVIETKNVQQLTSGIATIAYQLDGKMDVLYWDIEALAEDSEEYGYYKDLTEEGYTMLWGTSVYSPVMNGPFGIKVNALYDVDKINKLFLEFGWEKEE